MTHSETVRHVGDATVIPMGLVAVIGSYLGLINEVLTALVLLSTLVWTVYRSVEIRQRIKNGPANKD